MNHEQMTVDVIIPTYRPDGKLDDLIRRLEAQTRKPDRIILIHTRSENSGRKPSINVRNYACYANVDIIEISKEEFDHGGTRNRAAATSDADIFLFMTQDAVPMNKRLISEILKGFSEEDVAAVYARQVAGEHANPVEKYTRDFNYPAVSRKKTKEDLKKIGIKTYFCSNTCAAYRRSCFEEMDGFVPHTIFGEDMIMAAKLIQAGYAVYYAAEAKVLHWHDYKAKEQFHRNFDNGVSQKMYEELFSGAKAEGEGVRLVLSTMAYLISIGKPWRIPGLIWVSASKYAGFFLGKRYQKLPKSWCRKFSMSPNYHLWEK